MYSKDVSSCSSWTRLIAYYQVSTCKIFNAEIIADENVSPLREHRCKFLCIDNLPNIIFRVLSNIVDSNRGGEEKQIKKKNVGIIPFYSSPLIRDYHEISERTKRIIPRMWKIWNFVKTKKR